MSGRRIECRSFSKRAPSRLPAALVTDFPERSSGQRRVAQFINKACHQGAEFSATEYPRQGSPESDGLKRGTGLSSTGVVNRVPRWLRQRSKPIRCSSQIDYFVVGIGFV